MVMTPLGKSTIVGGLNAIGAAFVWALLATTFMFFEKHGPQQNVLTILAFASYAVLMTSWFVLPLGIFLGALLPRLVRGCTGRGAFVRGALVGVGVALIAGVLATLMVEWPRISGREQMPDHASWQRSLWLVLSLYVGSMSAICSWWVGLWAMLSRRSSP